MIEVAQSPHILEPKNLPDNLNPQPEVSSLTADVQNVNPVLKFDPKALQKRYIEEREKRMRHNAGVEQYRHIDNEFSSFLTDPYRGTEIRRQPMKDACEVLIVGGGFGGQLIATQLLEQGVTDIRIVEKAADFGGTWYWNRYPGAQCDIESYVYMPLLDETGYVPTWKYAGGNELREYSQMLGRRYGLYEKAVFQTEVKSMRWIEDSASWCVRTDRNDEILARFVVPAAGPLHRPKLPGLPGLGTFKGHSFHTSRWDFEYTGGDISGNLHKLADKRVGVIGTGATSVQIVPHLGGAAKELYVFQRTPSSIDVRGNKPTDPEWVATLGEHWQKQRMDNFNILVNGGKQDVDLVADGWTDIIRNLGSRNSDKMMSKMDPKQMAEKRQLLDFEKMEGIRARVDQLVKDPETAEQLKPYYNQFCKRPCFHDEYLPTFNRSNVHLIDTNGQGVQAITEKGVVANKREIELDCLIFATGFELATSWTEKSGIEMYGRDGLPLTEKWADGYSTLHGMTSRSFPNCFFVGFAQAANSPNFLHMTSEQGKHIGYIVGKCHKQNVRTLEPTQDAEDAWVQTIIDNGKRRGLFQSQCTPGYYNNEGRETTQSIRGASHGAGALEFIRILKAWRDKDDLEGLDVKYHDNASSN